MVRRRWSIVREVVAALLMAGCQLGPTSPLVIPARPQPFSVEGEVADQLGQSLGMTRLEILDGAHAGTVVVADADGRFRFDKAFTDGFSFRASKDGYAPVTLRAERPLTLAVRQFVSVSLVRE